MVRHRLQSVSLAVIVLLCGGFLSTGAISPATLQSDVNSVQAAGASSVVAQVNTNGATTDSVAGTAQLGTITPVSPNTHYRTGSVTKTFVAATLLQLVGEGRLSLDDTVDRWLPGLIAGNGNDGTKITVRQILQHTSGLFNYTSDSQFVSALSSPSGYLANRDNQYTPTQLVNIALSHSPVFTPGTAFQYSNTGYIVAGLIIKAVTGNTWDVEVANRIITPLGLSSTSIPGSVETLPAPYSHGYNIWTPAPNRTYTDTTIDNMSWGDAAGAIVTTTGDENKFYSALLAGRVLAPAQLTQMETTVQLNTKTGYGLGIAHSVICKTDLWWHEGGTLGFETLVIATPTGGTSLAYNISTTTYGGNDTAFTNGTNNAQDALVRDAFCAAASNDSITAQESVVGSGSVVRIR